MRKFQDIWIFLQGTVSLIYIQYIERQNLVSVTSLRHPQFTFTFFSSLCLQTVHAVAGIMPPSPPTNMGPSGGSASAPPPLHSPHMRKEQFMPGNSAPNSPMAMLNIGSSHEKEVGNCKRAGQTAQ